MTINSTTWTFVRTFEIFEMKDDSVRFRMIGHGGTTTTWLRVGDTLNVEFPLFVSVEDKVG